MLQRRQERSCSNTPVTRNVGVSGYKFLHLSDRFLLSSEQQDGTTKCIYWLGNISIPTSSSRLRSAGGKREKEVT